MSNELVVYPKKLKGTAQDLAEVKNDIQNINEKLNDVKGKISGCGSYGEIIAALSSIIDNNAKYIKSSAELQKALKEAAEKYERTEKKIVNAKGVTDSRKSRGGGGGGGGKGKGDSSKDDEDDVWEYIRKTLLQVFHGDFTDESTLVGTILSVAVGFIPYVGTAADIRDVVADIIHLIDDGPETKEWVDLGFSLLAVIPAVGDFLKHADELKPLLKYTDEVADFVKGIGKKADEVISSVNTKTLDKFKEAYDEIVDGFSDSAKNIAKKLEDGAEDFAEGVSDLFKKTINKDGDTVGNFVDDLLQEFTGVEDVAKDFISDTIDFFTGDKELSIGDVKISIGFSSIF